MPFMRRVPVASLAALSAFASVAAAADSADEQLEEIIVTARSLEVSTPLELSRYGYDVEFVTSDQIKDAGLVDLPQAIEYIVPGAFVAAQFGPFSYNNISLQGSRPGDLLWTVDGVRITNRLYGSSAGTSPADTLPASMIERLEVMKGGNGVLYGTQATAGVINLVTRSFSDTPSGAISVGGDSRDGIHVNGYGRGAVGRHRFVAWASKDESDGHAPYDVVQPGATTRDRHYDVESFGLRYGLEFTDTLRLTLQGQHTEASLDYPNVFTTDANERNQDIWSARLDYSPSDRVDVFLKGYVHDWDSDYVEDIENPFPVYWGFEDVGVSAAARIDGGRGLEYHFGYEFQKYNGRDDYLIIEQNSESASGVFAQVRTTDDLSERARVTAGLRYSDSGGASATVWSTSAAVDLTDSLFLEGTLGTSFVLPDAYQLFANDPFDTRGNTDLEPEKSFNINLALGGSFSLADRAMGWQISGWQRSVDNLIVSDDSNPPPGFDAVFDNVDTKAKVSGYELLLRGAITPALSFDTSFLYSREKVGGRQLANRPRRSAKLGLHVAPLAQHWGADLALKYIGKMWTNVTGFPQQTYGEDVVASLGAHWFVDGEARRHRLGLRVENLFDTDYETRIRSSVLSGSSPATRFMYRNVGQARTFYGDYTFSF